MSSSSMPPPSSTRLRLRVFGDEEMQDLGDRARRHVRLEHFADLRDLVAGFFAQFEPDAHVRVLLFEQAGARFDQHARSRCR